MYTGPWIYVHKVESFLVGTPSDSPPITLIHEDEPAKRLGFRAGIVGGLVLEGILFPVIDSAFGHLWYEGGTYSVRHKTPAYEGEVRAVWEEAEHTLGDARSIKFWLENKAGEKSTHGWASLSKSGKKLIPPWERQSFPTLPTTDEDLIPEFQMGSSRLPFQVCYTIDEMIKRHDRFQGCNWWHRVASPWGQPITTGFEIVSVAYKDTNYELNYLKSPTMARLRTPMDAGHDMVIYRPMFLGQTYNVSCVLRHKWQTERSVFFVHEYTIKDQNESNIALMRTYVAHLIKDLKPAAMPDKKV